MLKLIILAAAVLCTGTAQAAGKRAAPSGLPPIIDRELLFGNPEITQPSLSPDGTYLAFMKPWKDTINIWVKRAEEPFSAARLLTAESKRPVPAYLWTRDSKRILYVKDNAGDENFNLYSVDPAGKPAEGGEAPPSKDLTGLKGVRVMLYSVPKSDPDVIYIGINDRDKAWHDLYKVKLSSGETTLVRKNTDRIAAWVFDEKGQLRLAMRVADNGDQEILRADPNSLRQVYSCSVFEMCGPVRFHKDGSRVYILTNKGEADLLSLALFNPTTGDLQPVESDPVKRVDFGGAMFSEATDELVMTSYTDDHTRRYFKDKQLEKDYASLQKRFAGREVSIASRTNNERVFLLRVWSDTEPGMYYLFDRNTHKINFQFKVRENLPRESLSSMKPVRYTSSDGLEVPAYVVLPKGLPEKNLPALVIPHGGPWGRDSWGYNPLAQFFANRGYAVLMPNFRASTGYGKKFLNAGNGEWGRKMQDDITFGVKYLTAQGIADPKRVGILGISYGGYATLAGVAFTPDLYRAAVDIVGPANLTTLLEAIPPYWEAGRKIMYARMADLSTDSGKAWLKERSPLTAADNIKTPLLVVQGANDPRVNKREAEQIVIALRDRSFPVEYLLAPDEGHGFARPVNNTAMYMAAEKFLAKHLDGRYQEGGAPEVVQRLKEITIDPKTVVLSKIADASAVGVPKLISRMSPGEYNYSVKIAMGGREMAMKMSTVIKEENGSWTAVERMETPMGAAVDTSTLDKNTLLLKKRSARQGPMSVEMEFGGNRMNGTITMNGPAKPISADVGGPVFADGAGAQHVIALLPLADGYSTVFRNFDLQKQKVKLIQLKVEGSESVTVPAGTFDSYRVHLTSAEAGSENITVWIAKDTRKPVKASAVMSQMGGATMTSELMP